MCRQVDLPYIRGRYCTHVERTEPKCILRGRQHSTRLTRVDLNFDAPQYSVPRIFLQDRWMSVQRKVEVNNAPVYIGFVIERLHNLLYAQGKKGKWVGKRLKGQQSPILSALLCSSSGRYTAWRAGTRNGQLFSCDITIM